ncbi:MAG TPA: MFS transporter [Steroidobacteraceae bacterium]|nr:MFS transporter [Steroidobacteraceae bacterium]
MSEKSGAGWGHRHTVLMLSFAAVFIGYTDRVNMSVASVTMRDDLHWTQATKGFVLSAFFIGYMVSLLPSGWLATRYGGKRVLAVAVLGWSVFAIATPAAAHASLSTLVAMRIGLGLCEGSLFPACYEILGRWIPAHERARATIRLISGIPVGQVVGLAASGWLVGQYGWPTVFYGFGVLGLIWAVFWVKVVKSDPATHPDLSPEERVIYADHSFGVRYNSLSGLAWRAQLKDSAVWAAIFALFCGNWALYFLLSWLPSYLRDAHALTLSTAGLFAAGPWASYLLFGNVAASLADAAIGRGRDVTVIRKLVLCPAFIVAAACLYGSQAAATSEAAMGVLCAATGALGVASSAYSPNFLELVPGRAALFIAFGNTLATIPGIAGVAVTGWTVDRTGSYTTAFVTTALVMASGAVVYLRYGSGRAIRLSNGS